LELNLEEFHVLTLEPKEFIPAPAQGVLGLQIRNEDTELFDVLQKMNFPDVQKRIELERKVLNLLDGGCQLPLGVYCTPENELFVSFAKHSAGKCFELKYQVESFEGMAEKVIDDLKKVVAFE